MMKFWSALCLSVLASWCSALEIRLASDATVVEQTAAKELRAFAQQLLGSETAVAASPAVFVLGQSEENAKAFGISEWSTLAPDEILGKSEKGVIYLAGARPRGVLYAVYEYLERFCGVRFYAPDETEVPHLSALPVDGVQFRYHPAIVYRSPYFSSAMNENAFAARMRISMNAWNLSAEYGGSEGIWGWCHTFQVLIDPKVYFKDHPEWYSLKDGKRVAENSQLCLSNPALRKQLIENTLTTLRNNPGTKIITVSINDNSCGCQCPECRKLDEQYGGPSGTLIWAVNQVADAVAKEFPGVQVDTIAYNHTMAAPTKPIRVADNLLVRMCFISSNNARPLGYHPSNIHVQKALDGWKKLTKNLSVWIYSFDAATGLIPYPDLPCIAPDCRWLSQNNVVSVFAEGYPEFKNLEELADLRVFLWSKLMWNPDLDQEALTRDFCNAYYGPAAPFVLAYINEVNHEIMVVDKDPFVGVNWTTTQSWQSTTSAVRAYEAMQQALTAVKDQPKYYKRVRIACLPSRFGILTRFDATRNSMEQGAFSKLDLPALLQETEAWSRECGYDKVYGDKFNKTMELLHKTVGKFEPFPLPSVCKGVSPKDYVVAPNFTLTNMCPSVWAWDVVDPAAISPQVMRFDGHEPTWLIQGAMPVPDYDSDWNLYCEMRCESGGRDIPAVQVGVYDTVALTGLNGRMIRAPEIEGKTYRGVFINRVKLNPSCIIWIMPEKNKDIQIWFDRIIAVRAK